MGFNRNNGVRQAVIDILDIKDLYNRPGVSDGAKKIALRTLEEKIVLLFANNLSWCLCNTKDTLDEMDWINNEAQQLGVAGRVGDAFKTLHKLLKILCDAKRFLENIEMVFKIGTYCNIL